MSFCSLSLAFAQCDLTEAINFALLLFSPLPLNVSVNVMSVRLPREPGHSISPSTFVPELQPRSPRLPTLPLITLSAPRELLNHGNIEDGATDDIFHCRHLTVWLNTTADVVQKALICGQDAGVLFTSILIFRNSYLQQNIHLNALVFDDISEEQNSPFERDPDALGGFFLLKWRRQT